MHVERETITVPLFQGADRERIEELRADFTEAASATSTGPRLLSDTEPEGSEALKAAALAHDEFVREATERAAKVVIQALTRKQKRSLEDQHPARMVTKTVKNEDGTERQVEEPHADDWRGFNFATMGDELVPASIAPGQFDTPADRDEFVDSLSDPHFTALYAAAIQLNYEAGGVPKAGASSLAEQIIAATSTSPEASD